MVGLSVITSREEPAARRLKHVHTAWARSLKYCIYIYIYIYRDWIDTGHTVVLSPNSTWSCFQQARMHRYPSIYKKYYHVLSICINIFQQIIWTCARNWLKNQITYTSPHSSPLNGSLLLFPQCNPSPSSYCREWRGVSGVVQFPECYYAGTMRGNKHPQQLPLTWERHSAVIFEQQSRTSGKYYTGPIQNTMFGHRSAFCSPCSGLGEDTPDIMRGLCGDYAGISDAHLAIWEAPYYAGGTRTVEINFYAQASMNFCLALCGACTKHTPDTPLHSRQYFMSEWGGSTQVLFCPGHGGNGVWPFSNLRRHCLLRPLEKCCLLRVDTSYFYAQACILHAYLHIE